MQHPAVNFSKIIKFYGNCPQSLKKGAKVLYLLLGKAAFYNNKH